MTLLSLAAIFGAYKGSVRHCRYTRTGKAKKTKVRMCRDPLQGAGNLKSGVFAGGLWKLLVKPDKRIDQSIQQCNMEFDKITGE